MVLAGGEGKRLWPLTADRAKPAVAFGADHVYRMDPSQMLAQHVDTGAGVTVAGIRVPRADAKAFGCIDSDASGKITRFLEKPAEPPHVPDDPDVTFASMGNYIFR